jgi:four helix bundle protein
MSIKSLRDLDVYRQAFELAMKVFELAKKIPKEETYSLTDQIRRSSRSVPINIREGFAKRRYQNIFVRLLTDAMGSSEETRGWLDFSLGCGYVNQDAHDSLDVKYDEVNAMLYSLVNSWKSM